MLANRVLVFFRPFTLDIMTGSASASAQGLLGSVSVDDWITGMRYELLFGGGMIF